MDLGDTLETQMASLGNDCDFGQDDPIEYIRNRQAYVQDLEIWTATPCVTALATWQDQGTNETNQRGQLVRHERQEQGERRMSKKKDDRQDHTDESDDEEDDNAEAGLREFRAARTQYLLDRFKLPTQVSDATMESIRRQFQRDGESAAMFGEDHVQWQMDIDLIQTGAVPAESQQEGNTYNHLYEIYKFTIGDMAFLYHELKLSDVLEVADDASQISARLCWENRERLKRLQQLRTEMRKQMQTPMSDFNSGLDKLESIRKEGFVWDLMSLAIRTNAFQEAFDDFSRCWRRVLTSARIMRSPSIGVPFHQIQRAFCEQKRRAERMQEQLGEHIVRAWELFDYLQEDADDSDGSSAWAASVQEERHMDGEPSCQPNDKPRFVDL